MFGGMGRPGSETQTCAEEPNQVPFRESRLRYVPGGSFHPGETETNAGATIKRRGCVGSVAFVISPPASTSRADERNVGEEIERIATSIAAPLRFPPADAAEQAEQNRRPHIKSEKSPLLRCRRCYFPGGMTTHGGSTRRGPKIRTNASLTLLPRLFSRRK